MKSSFKLVRVGGIDIEVHVTFLLLIMFFFVSMGLTGIMLVLGVFFFVTLHELAHSYAALFYGIKVKRITLLPIGGVAAMTSMPRKPWQELVISLAGPLSNILVVVVFYYPLRSIFGRDELIYPLMVILGKVRFAKDVNIIAYVYWLNLVLAAFNLLPAFPMDGGRVARALLAFKLGYKRATDIAAKLGHVFALFFAYVGIVHGHILLLVIAVFIYMSASTEARQVSMVETIKNYTVGDILSGSFVYISPRTPLSRIMELMFHTRQEDFPVIEDEKLVGMITRREIVEGLHVKGGQAAASDIMRPETRAVKVTDKLHKVQDLMMRHGISALPVEREERIVGVVTIDDINRIYLMVGEE